MQKAVDGEINKLLIEGPIAKIIEIKNNVYIQPTEMTVKKDRENSFRRKSPGSSKRSGKYQMPSLENLLDMVAEKLDTKEGEAWFSIVDMAFPYGQIPLHQLTAKKCNFQIISGESTGTFRFVTGFYSLSVIPTEFQN